MESYNQKRFVQRVEPVHGILTTSQTRIIPSAWSPEFQNCYEPVAAVCLPLSPDPFLFEGKCLMWISFSYFNILYWSVAYILSKWKKSCMWTWCRGLGISWNTWFWVRNSDQIVIWPIPLRNKECILCVGERTKCLFVDQNTKLWWIPTVLFPLHGNPTSLSFKATISVSLEPHDWFMADEM